MLVMLRFAQSVALAGDSKAAMGGRNCESGLRSGHLVRLIARSNQCESSALANRSRKWMRNPTFARLGQGKLAVDCTCFRIRTPLGCERRLSPIWNLSGLRLDHTHRWTLS